MSKINDGGAAFPLERPAWHNGMSLRDWFAGQAMAAAWNAFHKGYFNSENPARDIAAAAYQQADAMLAARKREDGA
jgi:hypothetical protein